MSDELDKHPGVIEALARNETKHVYKETSEEKMILGYRRLLDLDEENEDFAHVRQELVRQNSSNSRTKAMFLVDDVVQFYLALFRINDVFCNASCVSVRWANDNLRGPHGGVSVLTLID